MHERKVERKRTEKERKERISLATLSSADWYHHGCNILIAAALGEK
jgi:hypothetical protein